MAAVDAEARGVAGACARITRKGVPLQTTIVVLDEDLVAGLLALGVPLDDLLVPCPRGTAGTSHPTSGGDGSGGAAAGVGAAGPAAAGTSAGEAVGSSFAERLALTGGGLVPLGVAGVLLLATGVACSRHGRAPRSAASSG